MRKGQRAQKEKVEAIAKYILEDEEDIKETIVNLKHYEKEFWNIPDYNYYRYGNILPYYAQIREFYKEHGFPCNDDNELLCEDFCYHVGKAIDKILEENKQ
jgi:hypothetical protein